MSAQPDAAAGRLRRAAGALADPLPPLLAQAERLAQGVMLGEHGRRRSGLGDEFWQYRAAVEGDEARLIDWRRSAKSDAHFIRQKEWQAVQTVLMWVDGSASMSFASGRDLPRKSERAKTLALALAILLLRAGESVGLADGTVAAAGGQGQILRLAGAMSAPEGAAEYGTPRLTGLKPNIRGLFLSDFMGDLAPVEAALTRAAERGVRGAVLQVLDPAEEAFPYDGRTIFESMAGGVRHETLKAGDLRGRYRERLQAQKEALAALTRTTGWLWHCHHTDQSASAALLWLYAATERRQR